MTTELEKMGMQIANYVNDPIEKAKRLIVTPVGQARLIICTNSPGTDAAFAVQAANNVLSDKDKIVLVEDLCELTDAAQIVSIINDGSIEPTEGAHVAFSLCDQKLARQVEHELDLKMFSEAEAA
ncbi:MAG: hypothetical protein ACX933_05485 [Marinobacter adhaerens]